MTFEARLPQGRLHGQDVDGVLKIACFAVGGQGGGVLNGWIVDLAERHGFEVQATSVAGVAQRTGATIYYVEMMPKTDAVPVFALAPSEGDVDVLIAAELMEAGRAITRGFVTPGRTTCIVSTHRQLATVEKVVPGTGEADATAVMSALEEQAGHLIAFDLQKIAETSGTVISAALFGALAASKVLPFEVEAFRDTIRKSGRAADRSLAAFDAAYSLATGETQPEPDAISVSQTTAPTGPADLRSAYDLLDRRVAKLPAQVAEMAGPGLRKTVGFQDLAYGEDYLTRVEAAVAEDIPDRDFAYSCALAKHLANAMAYDDIIRVADAKTKPGRFARIDAEIGAKPQTLTRVTEYTHPGAAEVISMMPRGLGLWFEARPKREARLDRLVNRGRHIRTDRLVGFLSLYLLAGLKPLRRKLLRHTSHLEL